MTYNFDPDQWLDIQVSVLEKRLADGEITEQKYKQALEELERRYLEMWQRLDGTYQLPE